MFVYDSLSCWIVYGWMGGGSKARFLLTGRDLLGCLFRVDPLFLIVTYIRWIYDG